MPIYEYRCLKCESHFEKMQKISDDPLTLCEKCGGALEKQWSLSGFQFKGAGWYVTDTPIKENPIKTEAKSEGTSTAPAETKSEPSTSSATPAAASEKSSQGESTAKTESASNTTKSDASASRKE